MTELLEKPKAIVGALETSEAHGAAKISKVLLARYLDQLGLNDENIDDSIAVEGVMLVKDAYEAGLEYGSLESQTSPLTDAELDTLTRSVYGMKADTPLSPHRPFYQAISNAIDLGCVESLRIRGLLKTPDFSTLSFYESLPDKPSSKS